LSRGEILRLRLKNDKKRRARDNNITVPPPIRAEVRGESSIQIPAADIALPRVVVSHSDHGAVGFKPHRV